MQEYVHRAMYGDKTCTLDNLNMSCFAAERCALARNTTEAYFPSQFENTPGTFTLIAHSTRSNHEMRTTAVDNFIGCVGVGPASVYARSMFPQKLDISNAYVIFNLCVSSTFKGKGKGRLLVDAAKKRVTGPLYLFVLTRGTDSHDPNVSATMTARIKHLKGFYTHLGMERIEHVGSHILFKVT